MAKKLDAPRIDALIFVDTNILLDFYRVQNDVSGLELLDKLESHKDLIVTGAQVEMEYKKNRQKVILGSLNALKTPEWSSLNAPTFMAGGRPYRAISAAKRVITTQQGNARERLTKILSNPSRTDPVYKKLERIFRHKSPYNLSTNVKAYSLVRELAITRFNSGYPPRKDNDSSIGDALNWEWIVSCAKESGKGVILVTRDSDFGMRIGGQSFLNDWLRQEFRERVGRNKVILTERLADAFRLIAVPVSTSAEAEELVRVVIADAENDRNDQGDTQNSSYKEPYTSFGSTASARGLNAAQGAFGGIGASHERIKAAQKALLGSIVSPETVKAMQRTLSGIGPSPEAVKTAQRVLLGSIVSPDAVKAMQRTIAGKRASPEAVKAAQRALLGSIVSPETMKAIQRTIAGKGASPEAVKAAQRALLGSIVSPETIKAMQRTLSGVGPSPSAVKDAQRALLGSMVPPETITAMRRAVAESKDARRAATRVEEPRAEPTERSDTPTLTDIVDVRHSSTARRDHPEKGPSDEITERNVDNGAAKEGRSGKIGRREDTASAAKPRKPGT